MPDFKLGEAYVELTTRGSVKPGLEREKDAADAAATEFRTASADITRSAEAIAAATQRAKAVAELKAPPGPGTVGFDQRPKPGALTPDESLREDKENARKRREAEQERQRTLKSDPDYVASLEMKQAEFRAQVRESRRAQDPEYDRKESLREEREKQRDAATEYRRAGEEARVFGGAVAVAGRVASGFAAGVGLATTVAKTYEQWTRSDLRNVGLSNPALAYRSERTQRDLEATVGRFQEGGISAAEWRNRLMGDLLAHNERRIKGFLGDQGAALFAEFNQLMANIPGWSRAAAWAARMPASAQGKSVGAAPNPMLGQVFEGDSFYRAFAMEAIRTPWKKGGPEAVIADAAKKLFQSAEKLTPEALGRAIGEALNVMLGGKPNQAMWPVAN